MLSALVGVVLLGTGCAGPAASADRPVCVADGVPDEARERYTIEDPPSLTGFRFCETPDADGASATLTFVATPRESTAYLDSLHMRWDEFRPAAPEKVRELARDGQAGWKLTAGKEYLVNWYSREWNGSCLADYTAYVPAGEDWRGEVFIGVYCQV
ncbi:hypothetical protein [Streptomyces sp. NPDC048659]|uniref:hypothetical protein n=1 Tax=Streptomyces sp. NPDC048659 TaxID=3155489 RepID=UPI00343569AB